jgi:NADH dehydrogenase
MQSAHDASVKAPRLVVTGAGGFVGKCLVSRLIEMGAEVIGIGRGERPAALDSACEWVKADVAGAHAYTASLAGADAVIHLAALTGKAGPEQFKRENVDATRALLSACSNNAVRRFIFVSSIAASFRDRRYYHYAESKRAAEVLVRAANIAHVIVRPTMILGPDSAIEGSLTRLARLPISPMFGAGLHKVQPIDVDDVAAFLAALAFDAAIQNQTIELGGPERFSLRELYVRLRAGTGASGPPRFVYLPVDLIRAGLAAVEPLLLRFLPLTAGQLASFVNDSVAEENTEIAARLSPAPRRSPRVDTAAAAAGLVTECRRFTAYLIGLSPSDYQIDKYIDAHRRRGSALQGGAFDRLTLSIARSGGLGLAAADAYCALFARKGALRNKLVLALAVAETAEPSASKLDTPEVGAFGAWLSLCVKGALSAAALLITIPVLGPAHVVLAHRRAP